MFTRAAGTNRRGGATTVEMAFILPVFVLFLFGIFELGRFLFVYTTITNAVRDGCRYAVARAADSTVTTSMVQSVVTNKMSGTQNHMLTYTINVMYADPGSGGLAASPPVLRDYSSNPMPNGWKNASFPDKIAVQLTGTYCPAMTNIVHLPTTIPLSVNAVMTSEQ